MIEELQQEKQLVSTLRGIARVSSLCVTHCSVVEKAADTIEELRRKVSELERS